MGDPLSMVLAGMAIATALKDVIELWDKISESFSRVSENPRRAQQLVSEIRNTLDQLTEFCEKHGEVLNTSAEMRTAIGNLKTKIHGIHTSCSQFIPRVSERRLGRYILKYYAWRNGSKIEAEIMDLRKNIENCYALFTMFTAIRTELTLVNFQQANSATSSAILNAMSGLTALTDARVRSFSPPAKPVMSRPPSMDELVLGDMYLRLQVDSIIKLLNQLPLEIFCNPKELKESVGHHSMPLCIVLPHYSSEDREICHENAVYLALRIKDILRSRYTVLFSVQGILMNNLAHRLSALNMLKEAVDIQNCTVKLYRILISVDANVYTPYLIHELSNLSSFHLSLGNMDEATKVIDESVRIIQDLQAGTSMDIVGTVLTRQANVLNLSGMSTPALQIVEEAVAIYEQTALMQGSFMHQILEGGLSVNQEFSIVSPKAPTMDHIDVDVVIRYHYAQTLEVHSTTLTHNGRIPESINTKMKVLHILQDIFLQNPNSSVDLDISGVLCSLTDDNIRPSLPNERSMIYIDQAVQTIQKYCNLHPNKYGKALCDAMKRKALILWEMERQEDAIICWKTITEIARKLVDDQIFLTVILQQFGERLNILKRADEAATAFKEVMRLCDSNARNSSQEAVTQANEYLHLSINFRTCGRYEEAKKAALSAVKRYRIIAFGDPEKRKYLAYGLYELSLAFLYTGFPEDAIDSDEEALNIYQPLLVSDALLMDEYVGCLGLISYASTVTDDEIRSIQCCENVVQHFETLFSTVYSGRTNFELANAQLILAANLARFGRLIEATNIIDDILSNWELTYGALDNIKAVPKYMLVLICSSVILTDQGSTSAALNRLTKALAIGAPFVDSNTDVADSYAKAMARRVIRLCHLGRGSEALGASERITEFVRTHTLLDPTTLIHCWEAVAHAALHNFRPMETVDAARQALSICHGPEMRENTEFNPWALERLPDSLRYLSMGFADQGDMVKALEFGTRAVEEALQLKSHPRLSWIRMEPIYVECRHNLADCMVANNDFTEALGILIELQAYYAERAKIRNILYVNLASIFLVLSILYCALGHHSEGIAAAAQLKSLKNQLEMVFPSLARQVNVRLVYIMKRASAAALREAKARLKCEHTHMIQE